MGIVVSTPSKNDYKGKSVWSVTIEGEYQDGKATFPISHFWYFQDEESAKEGYTRLKEEVESGEYTKGTY